jgi:hypothetical protein
MSYHPPLPETINTPIAVAGNVLSNQGTSIELIGGRTDGTIVMQTESQNAMIINPNQCVSINTQLAPAQLTVNSDTTNRSTLRLSYQDSYYFDMLVNSNGNVSIIPSCDNTSLDPNLTTSISKNVNIPNHDGISKGLFLNGTLVQVTASELNYLDVPVGIATANKAVILDNSKNLLGLNNVTTSTISGTLITASQPNIRTLNTINITGTIAFNGGIITASAVALNSLTVTPGVGQANGALILDSSRNIGNIHNLTATNLTGTLTNGPQPFISSLGALTALTNNGLTYFNDTVQINTDNILLNLGNGYGETCNFKMNSNGDLVFKTDTGNHLILDNGTNLKVTSHDGTGNGLILGNTSVYATATQLNYNTVTPGAAQPTKTLVVDSTSSISGIGALVATTLGGTLTTALQPNLTTVNVLNILNHNGVNLGLALSNILVTASGTQLNYNNVSPGLASANKSMVLDSNSSISGVGTLSATYLVGTLQTPYQPNVTSVSTLNITNHNGSSLGLSLANVLVTSSALQLNYVNVNQGVATAVKAMVLDSGKSISGINSLSALLLSGTIQTANQPNILSVNTLNIQNHDASTKGLSLGGVLITVSALQINKLSVSEGVASSSSFLCTDSGRNINNISNLSATYLSGILLSGSQPNIFEVNNLNIINHNGTTQGLSLGGVLITVTAYQMNYLNSTEGSAVASKALILNSSKNIIGINALSANQLSGTLQTAAQPNISSVNNLNITNHNGTTQGLSLGGTLITVTPDQFNYLNVTAGYASVNTALVVDSARNIAGINSLSATTFVGTIFTPSQPNISLVNALNIANHDGSTIGLSLRGILITATANQINTLNTSIGNAVGGKALICDSFLNINGLNILTATTLNGTLGTPVQPYITSVNTLNITRHDGASQGLSLNSVLVTANANQLNYNNVSPGNAIALKTLVTDAYTSISGINTLSANLLRAQSLSVSGIISSFNTGALVAKTYSSTNFNGRTIDMQLVTSLSILNFAPAGKTTAYSTQLMGYILPPFSETYTFYIQCEDRVRLFVNNQLIANSWSYVSGTFASLPIYLNANQWTPIYIEYQVDNNSPVLVVQWASTSLSQDVITTAYLAWDSNSQNNIMNYNVQNSLTLYNSATSSANTTSFTVNTSGNLTINTSGNTITLGSNDNLNIPCHNGTNAGLYLGGSLVTATAIQLNYLNVTPGNGSPSQALILDSSKSIIGISSLTSTTISCTNLSTSNFTISNLLLNGALNNYNTGGLLIRQITGLNLSGRVVNVDVTNNLQISNYDPKGLNSNYSIDILGYLLPQFSEAYTFYVVTDYSCRIFINGQLILNIWNSTSQLQYSSIPITLTAGSWVSIYIEAQHTTGSQLLQIQWSSATTSKSFIGPSSMSWDNTRINIDRPTHIPDTLTLYTSSPNTLTPITSSLAIDSSGNLTLSSSANNILIPTGQNFNIIGHNTSSSGLTLAGVLVKSSANELNYLSGVNPGSAIASKVIVSDSGNNISGLNTLSANSINGIISTAAQPNIRSLGTLNATLITANDIVFNNTTNLRIITDSTGSYLQPGVSSTTGSSCDFMVTNYNQQISVSNRKFIIKGLTGNVGIQTSSPARPLSVNSGSNSLFSIRLINNTTDGTETNYTDLGTSNTGIYNISPSGAITNINSNLSIGRSNPAVLSIVNGALNIASYNGSVQIGNTSSYVLPLEIGSISYSVSSSAYGFLDNTGATGSKTNSSSVQCSLRTVGSIIVGGSVCVTSDRRVKNNISSIDMDNCRTFIQNINPVMFTYSNLNENHKIHYGFIAQDVYKTKFTDLVSMLPDDTIHSSVESDGFINPEGIKMNLSYTEIIPILTNTVKDLYNENTRIKKDMSTLMDSLALLKSELEMLKNQYK